jgi:nickel-type superoxide dismutase maturation protease
MPRFFIARAWRTLHEGVFFLFGRRAVFAVQGRSMTPTLQPGDRVFVCPSRLAQEGELVVARLPDGAAVVKRLASRGRGTFALRSDNPLEGSDSRHFGSLPDEAMVGPVVLTWPWR